MKHFLFGAFILFSTYCSAQKYVLVDKNMSLPVTYTDAITMQDGFKGYFPVEKEKIKDFITEIEKIARVLSDPKEKKPEKIDLSIGTTIFHGLRVPLSIEERMDIVLTTDYGTGKSTMHLSDAKISNANNAFFIKTWLKYLRGYIN
ncbi:MAG: hypothetical protein ABIN97_12960 [Ginsengibacter sp.]